MENAYRAGEKEEIHQIEDEFEPTIENAGEVQQKHEEQYELKGVDFEDSPHGLGDSEEDRREGEDQVNDAAYFTVLNLEA